MIYKYRGFIPVTTVNDFLYPVCLFPVVNLQEVILIVLSLSVVVVTAIALIFYR